MSKIIHRRKFIEGFGKGLVLAAGYSARAQVGLPTGHWRAPAPPPFISLTDHFHNDVNAGSHSFTNRALGAADPNRYIFAHCSTGTVGIRVISSVSIGGSPATMICRAAVSAARSSEWWYALVPVGTTATVTVSYSGSNSNNVAVGLYSVKGPINVSWAAGTDYATGGNAATFTPAGFITAPGDGLLAGVGCAQGLTVTWTSPSGSEDYLEAQPSATSFDSHANHGFAAGASWSPNFATGSNLSNYTALVVRKL